MKRDVVGECRTGHDQTVHLELSRGEPLQIHVGFQFAVELLAGAMVPVKRKDFLLGELQGGPPPFHLNVGNQQVLALLVDRALDDADDTATGEALFETVFIGPGVLIAHTQERYALSWPRLADLALGKSPAVPVGFAVTAGVHLRM